MPSFPNNSYEISATEDFDGHTVEALGILQRQSLALLDVDSVKGSVAFLPHTPFEPEARPLAYKLSVTSVPYSQAASNVLTSPSSLFPPEKVTNGIYAVVFSFRLKDNQGFTLAEVETESVMQTEQIRAGETKNFQGVTTNAVSPYVASATHSIDVRVGVVRATAMIDDSSE